MIFGFIIVKAIKWVFRSISNLLTESGKRKYTRRLRQQKERFCRDMQEIDEYQSACKKNRLELEIQRRKALRMYLNANITLLIECQKILHDAKQEAYDNIKSIYNNIRHCKEKKFENYRFLEFRKQYERIHLGIKEIKAIEQNLNIQIKSLRKIKEEVPWKSKRLGSKRKIMELQSAIEKNLVNQYGVENSQLGLEFDNYSFELDCYCPKCNISSSSNMRFCFNCGKVLNDLVSAKFYKKYVVDEFCKCKKCNAPLGEGFKYCYNCGLKHDPYGFYLLLK